MSSIASEPIDSKIDQVVELLASMNDGTVRKDHANDGQLSEENFIVKSKDDPTTNPATESVPTMTPIPLNSN